MDWLKTIIKKIQPLHVIVLSLVFVFGYMFGSKVPDEEPQTVDYYLLSILIDIAEECPTCKKEIKKAFSDQEITMDEWEYIKKLHNMHLMMKWK